MNGPGTDFNAERLAIAQRVCERVQTELGEHLNAAAVYGSVAHGAAGADSDVELTLIKDKTVPYADKYCFEQGIMVEYTLLQGAAC